MTALRVSLDSNVLIYAALEPGSEKGQRAADVIKRAAGRGILATQALLEFVAVVRRRAPDLTGQAIRQAEAWAGVFETVPTTDRVARAAHNLIDAHKFQVWDAVIWSAACSAGASVLLSEDLQDGLELDGMRAINPFVRSQSEIGFLLPDDATPGSG